MLTGLIVRGTLSTRMKPIRLSDADLGDGDIP